MRGFHNNAFDPQMLAVLEAAYDEAWLTLKSVGNTSVKPDELARSMLRVAMEGERDPAGSTTVRCNGKPRCRRPPGVKRARRLSDPFRNARPEPRCRPPARPPSFQWISPAKMERSSVIFAA